MKNIKQVAAGLINDLKANVQASELHDKTAITRYELATESFDNAEKEIIQTNKQTLDEKVSDAVSDLTAEITTESYQPTDAQIIAAKSIAALAVDPRATFESMNRLNAPVVDGRAVDVDITDLSVEDFMLPEELTTEAFDGQEMNNAIYFSVAFNYLASRQDEFGEAFYPTIAIDPKVSGATITTRFTSLYTEFTRGIDGTPDRKKFNKIPIVKALYDNNIFGIDKNRLVPVSRTENADYLLTNLAHEGVSFGETVTTAPIKFGQRFGLLGASQVDSLIAKGLMDETDTLDRRVNLEKVYYSLKGTDTNGDAYTEYFVIDTSKMPHSNFTHTTQGNNKDLALNFTTESYAFNTGTIKVVPSNAAPAVYGDLTDTYDVKLELRINGSLNVAEGDVVLDAAKPTLLAIKDSNGNELASTDSQYIAVKAIIDTMTLDGYELETYVTNSNNRIRGRSVTSDKETYIYTVPMRSGYNIKLPLNNSTGTDGDAEELANLVTWTGIDMSINAVKALVNYAEILNGITNNGFAFDAKISGAASELVDVYYKEITIDLLDKVDSDTGRNRKEDIKATLENIIADAVSDMHIDSNYINAWDASPLGKTGNKPTVIMGTNHKIKNALTYAGNPDLGTNYGSKVVSTQNPLIGSRIFVTFGVYNDTRNTVPEALNSGQMYWAPTIATDLVRGGSNNKQIRELNNMPRYWHVNNLPVMLVINVTNLETVLGKVSKEFKNV